MAKMQDKETYLELWRAKTFVNERAASTGENFIDLCHADFDVKKQGEAFRILLFHLDQIGQNETSNIDENAAALLNFIQSEKFANKVLQMILAAIVSDCFGTIVSMKRKGKDAWQNILLCFSSVYKSDYKNIAAVMNFKAVQKVKPTPAEDAAIEPTPAEIVTNDDADCDTCPKSISQGQSFAIQRGKKSRK